MEGFVESCPFPMEHAGRPAVGSDVVKGREQNMLSRFQPQELEAEDGPAAQVERLRRFTPEQRGELRIAAMPCRGRSDRSSESVCAGWAR